MLGSSSIKWRGKPLSLTSLIPWFMIYCWKPTYLHQTDTEAVGETAPTRGKNNSSNSPCLDPFLPDRCPHSHREMLHWILLNSCSVSKDTGKSPYTWDLRPLFEREEPWFIQNFGPSSSVRAKHKRSCQLLEWSFLPRQWHAWGQGLSMARGSHSKRRYSSDSDKGSLFDQIWIGSRFLFLTRLQPWALFSACSIWF